MSTFGAEEQLAKRRDVPRLQRVHSISQSGISQSLHLSPLWRLQRVHQPLEADRSVEDEAYSHTPP